MTWSPKLVAWTALTITASVVLLAWVFPDAIEHRGQIDATGTAVVVCAAGAHHSHDGRTQVLDHLANCARDNGEVRRELRDELSAILLLALTIAGTWQVARARHP